MNTATALFPLIIALPLLGFFINGTIGLFAESYRKQKTLIGSLASIAVFIPFLIAVYLFAGFSYDTPPELIKLFTWMQTGSFTADIAYRVDQLSLIMTLVVTGVGFLIHVYSMGYMAHDEGYWKFFAFLNLFIFAMLNLVLGNNLLLLFLGWEGVGVCSYLLIGFWYHDMAKSDAAKKAFIYNRIGDFAFLVAMFMIFRNVSSLDFGIILDNLSAIPKNEKITIALLMFVGATGKSAQIPLFVWLPDAMAGPTPVSALIHAATMVTSGVYLIARMSPMFVEVPEAMLVVAVIGALTAVVAATIAITQNDIKGVLAYSTVSQLGYMFLALGSGAFTAAIFHVATHAFFKACLFLGSGSVIHTMEHVEHKLHDKGKDVHFDPQDMRFMGGLRRYMPSTYRTFLIATIAIAGIPPLAGFFSKDEILAMVFNAGTGEYFGSIYIVLWGIGILTAFLTAFYMFRLTLTTFHGSFKLPQKIKEAEGSEAMLHESPATMTIPLWVLAFLATVGGFMGIPNFIVESFTHEEAHINWLHDFFKNVVADLHLHLSHPVEWALMGTSIVVAVTGVWMAFRMYNNDQQEASDAAIADRFKGIYRLWKDKYNLDEIYEGLISDPLVRFSDRVLAVFDMKVVDGIVNAIGGTVRITGSLFRYVQTGVVSSYAYAFVIGVIVILYLMIF
jgi:NADH-quinone oxidoreductase subunit L